MSSTPIADEIQWWCETYARAKAGARHYNRLTGIIPNIGFACFIVTIVCGGNNWYLGACVASLASMLCYQRNIAALARYYNWKTAAILLKALRLQPLDTWAVTKHRVAHLEAQCANWSWWSFDNV